MARLAGLSCASAGRTGTARRSPPRARSTSRSGRSRRVSVPRVPARARRSCLTVPASSERMLAKAPSLAADEVDRRPRGRGRCRGQGAGARARCRRAAARPARPDDRAARQRALDAVVGGRSARGRGGASRRGRTPQGRVPRGRVRCGRAAAGRNRPRGSDRDCTRPRRGRTDRGRRPRPRGARLRPGRHRRFARCPRPVDRSRHADYALSASSRPRAPSGCRRWTARTGVSTTISASSSPRGARSSTATTASG